ncbi:glycosyltransferase family 2 protein [Marixanthomonas sp. SCSIO 43207]|uniref:glycosyltransferase family 2 protein n=1 Tax=Marixanthomonas sp. SCSIO 43207 TaxID=2779360 RepID=UPI001CA81C6A|nr:glycosyltransferase family 2 protein [Marixanthomonas sp. SCSIO 43207]UAB81230.1 glycosyltransferase family 2 protein [Marixanthomonas sp. SCSIO 43207]
MQPLVSIIIPTYNRAHLIGETLKSIQAQTYSNWECIIVDDRSRDSTEELITSIVNKDSRYRYFKRSENNIKGASTCRNIGLKHSNGKYILFFDSDDILLPHTLQKRMSFIQENLGYNFWVFQTVRFYETLETADRIWNDLSKPNHQDLISFLSINPVWHTSGPIWKKKFLDKHSLEFTENVQSWQDWEFHIRVLLQNPKYKKCENLSAVAYQQFHETEAINKLKNNVVAENRISLFFTLMKDFKTKGVFDKKNQICFLKLFYFVLSKQKDITDVKAIWNKMEMFITLISKMDLLFWKYYLVFLKANTVKKSMIFLLLVKLKPYFEKRIPITDFKNRTWYRINIT